jgi:hypothetical protein
VVGELRRGKISKATAGPSHRRGRRNTDGASGKVAYARVVDERASYEGTSQFLHWWPGIMLLTAVGVLWVGWVSAVQWATFLVVAAWIQGHYIPWRFSVFDEGLALVFPFGRRVFLPKKTTTVRLETVGAVARVDGRHRLGYLLHDGVLYVPGRRLRLRRALDIHGYRIV